MSEREFFRQGGVVVTQSRIITPDQTFAMSGVTSVRYDFDPPVVWGPLLNFAVGALLIWWGVSGDEFGPAAFTTGAALVVVGYLWRRSNPGQHQVKIGTAGGERPALSSDDERFIRSIVAAVNDVMVARDQPS